MNKDNDGRIHLTFDEALGLLPGKALVHTFRDSGIALVGCDWDRKSVVESIKKHGAQLGGLGCCRIGHGLVLLDPAPLFIESVREEQERLTLLADEL